MLRPSVNPAVLRAPVAQFSVYFNEQDFAEPIAAALGIELPVFLSSAVRKRKMEYVAGRHCARQAIRAVLGSFDGDIARSADRAPEWPTGIVGSITHAQGFASAAVARSRDVRGIGLDCELVLSEDALRSVRSIVAGPSDPPPLGTGLPDDVYYTVLFSAKESLFKCLFPLVGKMFSFEDARMTIAPTDTTFRATLLRDLNDEFRAGLSLDGRYEVSEPYVHTALMLEP